jgi:hypothetical protein
MKYIENFYNKHGGRVNQPLANNNGDVDGDEDYIMCQMNNGSSILMFEKDES